MNTMIDDRPDIAKCDKSGDKLLELLQTGQILPHSLFSVIELENPIEDGFIMNLFSVYRHIESDTHEKYGPPPADGKYLSHVSEVSESPKLYDIFKKIMQRFQEIDNDLAKTFSLTFFHSSGKWCQITRLEIKEKEKLGFSFINSRGSDSNFGPRFCKKIPFDSNILKGGIYYVVILKHNCTEEEKMNLLMTTDSNFQIDRI